MKILMAIPFFLILARETNKFRNDRKMAKGCKRQDLSQFRPRFVHEVLASLVDAVYASDKNKPPDIDCESLGYEAEPLEVRDDDGAFRCRVFKRIERDNNRGPLLLRTANKSGKEQFKNVPLRKYVVAVRGTIITKVKDLIDDVEVLFESACELEEFAEPVLGLLLKLLDTVKPEDVWVTGHSLGALIVLVAARRLAEERDIALAVHLFNCPNLSPDLVFKKLAFGTMKGLGSAAGSIPLAGQLLKSAIKWTTSLVSIVVETSARKVCEVLAPKTYEQAVERNQRLSKTGFYPHMYVNPKDRVCNEYIRHFHPLIGGPAPASTFVLFRAFVGSEDPKPGRSSCHLIPGAFLHVNRWATGPWHAHKLSQWYKYDLDDLTSSPAGDVPHW